MISRQAVTLRFTLHSEGDAEDPAGSAKHGSPAARALSRKAAPSADLMGSPISYAVAIDSDFT